MQTAAFLLFLSLEIWDVKRHGKILINFACF